VHDRGDSQPELARARPEGRGAVVTGGDLAGASDVRDMNVAKLGQVRRASLLDWPTSMTTLRPELRWTNSASVPAREVASARAAMCGR